MNNKVISMFIIGILALSLVGVFNGSRVMIRPMNQMNHPGLDNPYQPPEDGPNHVGVSDYSNKFKWWWSELCEWDMQKRPANQGKNIPTFYNCWSNGGSC